MQNRRRIVCWRNHLRRAYLDWCVSLDILHTRLTCSRVRLPLHQACLLDLLTPDSPIDGTLNFVRSQEQFPACMLKIQVHGLPIVTTSIGLIVGGVPVVGVIYNPFLDLLVRSHLPSHVG